MLPRFRKHKPTKAVTLPGKMPDMAEKEKCKAFLKKQRISICQHMQDHEKVSLLFFKNFLNYDHFKI